MEESTKDGVDRSVSRSGIHVTTIDSFLPTPLEHNKDVVPNSQSLIKFHERIIKDLSSIQRRWIQKRSRAITNTSITASTSNEIEDENLQYQGVSLPPSIIQQNKLDLFKRLHELRKHRMALAAKIKVAKRRFKMARKATLHPMHGEQQPHPLPLKCNTPRTDGTTAGNEQEQNIRLLCDSDYQRHVWQHIREMRQMKCIQAAYPLTGISVTMASDNNISDSESMIIRFDIDHHNSYVCVFDIIHFATVAPTSESEYKPENVDDDHPNRSPYTAQLFLRLVHHNLPSAIPITAIFQKSIINCGHRVSLDNLKVGADDTSMTTLMIPIGFNMSSLLLDQSLNNINDVPSIAEQQSFIKQLQSLTQQIYHSCHAYHVRNNIYEYLQLLAGKNNGKGNNAPLPYSIQQLRLTYLPQQSLIYKTIEFHLVHQLSSIDQIQITLHYTSDLCRLKAHQPTSVDVKIISPSNQMDDILYNNKGDRRKHITLSVLQHVEGTVSDMEDERNDDDHNNHCESIESTIRSFRTFITHTECDTNRY